MHTVVGELEDVIPGRYIVVFSTECWEYGHFEVNGKWILFINELRVGLLICNPKQRANLWLNIPCHHSS